MEASARFAPNEALAARLLPVVADGDGDGSHDLSHILRVWSAVRTLIAREGGDDVVLTAATILHDCVNVPKDSPERSSASAMAARRASEVLKAIGWPASRIDPVMHAIEAHSFSAGVEPTTLEARILQDADRLDAIGHVGIARCFYVSGRMGGALYDPGDPEAANRSLDDSRFALDHFRTKLLTLSDGFRTDTGRRLARERHDITRAFLDGMLGEIAEERRT